MSKNNLLIIVIIAACVIAAGWYFLPQEEPAPPPPVPLEAITEIVQEPVAEPEPEPEVNDEPEMPEVTVVAPPLSIENSDSQVKLAIADFAPKLSSWLIPDEQIRKWVLTIDMMADGKLPKRYRPVDYPMPKFTTGQQGSKAILAPDNYQRMNDIINTVIDIDPEVLGRYYHEWLPTLEKAYREQGKPDTFDQRFRQTISQVLAVNTLEENPTLVRPSVLYQYADKNLEAATDIEKLLWRMGPENSEQLQGFLREFRYQLDQ